MTESRDSPTGSRSSTVLVNASSSAAAGIVGRIFTHPLDTVKARLQAPMVDGAPLYRGPVHALVTTARSEGLHGLYRGFGAVIIGGTPGTVLYLCSYDVAKRQLASFRSTTSEPVNTEDDFVVHFWSGMIAETIACIVYVPVDVVKERMQVQHRQAVNSADGTLYKNSWDALKVIARTEGLRGTYKGYAATLASFGPFSALYFVFYERFKLWSRGIFDVSSASNPSNDLPFRAILLCSASAGALSSWITSPLDMAKLRLQVNRGRIAANVSTFHTTPPVVYRGVVHCLQEAYATSGIRGLFRGAGARVLHFTPATTITMTCYETCRAHILNLLDGAA